MFRKNTGSQYLFFALVNASTGAALTGASVTAKVAIDNAAQVTATNAVVELAGGQYKLPIAPADVNGNNIGFLFTATNAIPVNITVVTTAADPTNATTFGLTNLDAAVTSRMASYTQPSGFLAATFPTGTIANTTNITAGTITTATNVTNGVTVATGGIISGANASAELNNIADAMLDRVMSAGTDSGGDNTTARTVRQALRALRNRVAIATGTMTVYKENDTTLSWQSAISTAPGNPVSESNPT